MGLEFMPIFEEWALDYDEEVNGGNPEYREVFANYWQILAEITAVHFLIIIQCPLLKDRHELQSHLRHLSFY